MRTILNEKLTNAVIISLWFGSDQAATSQGYIFLFFLANQTTSVEDILYNIIKCIGFKNEISSLNKVNVYHFCFCIFTCQNWHQLEIIPMLS